MSNELPRPQLVFPYRELRSLEVLDNMLLNVEGPSNDMCPRPLPQSATNCKDMHVPTAHYPPLTQWCPRRGKECMSPNAALTVKINIYDYTLSSDPLTSGTLERCKPPTRRARSCKDYTRTYAVLYTLSSGAPAEVRAYAPQCKVPVAVKIKALPSGAPCKGYASIAKNLLAAKI
jgi:hypothetical protein